MNRFATLAAAGAGAYMTYRWLWPGYDFRGKNVLLTGGSRGLGLVLARELAARGASLAICSRDPDELTSAFEELVLTGARVVAVECDVTDRDRVREFVAVARQRLGPVDVLVNNAGIIGVGALEDTRLEEFELSLKTHLWASLYTTLEVVPEMKARRTGRIVNISSFGGKVAVPHMLPYVVGKFALVGLSHGLRAELARYGIVVTTVCPGLMRTGSHIQAEFKGRHEEEYRWFAIGNAIPGFSMNAERAARQILRGVALGDAEVVLTIPAKAAVVAQALFPGLVSAVLAAANRFILPDPGGIGPQRVKGYACRAATPGMFTTLSDRASARNNEIRVGIPTRPLPAGGTH
ncbi:MAG: family NAD(P)-dependent oxidoreductase [Gemmataceae bacterium]|nr:family NAD(P)-dependent oxidoreductase [Gemmataceae bacterium]